MLGFQPEVCVCPSTHDIVIKLWSWGGKSFLFNWYVGGVGLCDNNKKGKRKAVLQSSDSFFFEAALCPVLTQVARPAWSLRSLWACWNATSKHSE